MTTPDTPESVRAVSESMRQLVTGRAIDVAEDWRRVGPRMPVLDAHNMLTRYAALLEQVAAHEKVCAGTWVKVTARLPEPRRVVSTRTADNSWMPSNWIEGGAWRFEHNNVVKWLDTRMSGEEG